MIPTADLANASDPQGEGLGQHITQRAKQLLAQLILPQKITKYEIERYYRKAHRTKAWRKLKPEAKALLYLARKTINLAKSEVLVSTLRAIFLEISLHTLKCQALLYGIILHLEQSITISEDLLKNRFTQILATGINYINNPLIFRIYG